MAKLCEKVERQAILPKITFLTLSTRELIEEFQLLTAEELAFYIYTYKSNIKEKLLDLKSIMRNKLNSFNNVICW